MKIKSYEEFVGSTNESLLDRIPKFVLDDRTANQFEGDISSKYQYKQQMQKDLGPGVDTVTAANEIGIPQRQWKEFIHQNLDQGQTWKAFDASKSPLLDTILSQLDKSGAWSEDRSDEEYFPESTVIIPRDRTYLVLIDKEDNYWLIASEESIEQY